MEKTPSFDSFNAAKSLGNMNIDEDLGPIAGHGDKPSRWPQNGSKCIEKDVNYTPERGNYKESREDKGTPKMMRTERNTF